MTSSNKTAQLQIRVSPADKEVIQQAAKLLNVDMSTYVLAKLLPQQTRKFQDLVNRLATSKDSGFVLAEINTVLSHLNRGDLKLALLVTLPVGLSDYLSNYLAAMVEYVCNQQQVVNPAWVKAVKPLLNPVFGSKLKNLRLYLLTHSPAPFRRRNIFVDTTIGGQI